MWLKWEPHIPNTTQTISNNVATAMQDHASLAGCHLNSWHMTSNWSSPCFFVSCVAIPHCPILCTSLVTVGMMDGEGGKATIGFLSFPINEDCVAASLFHKHKNTSLSPGVATKANLASGDGWKNTTQFSGPSSSQLRLGPSQASASRGGTSLLGHHCRPEVSGIPKSSWDSKPIGLLNLFPSVQKSESSWFKQLFSAQLATAFEASACFDASANKIALMQVSGTKVASRYMANMVHEKIIVPRRRSWLPGTHGTHGSKSKKAAASSVLKRRRWYVRLLRNI